MPKRVGIFVYGADWRSDPALMMCSEGARLLWWEMLLVMVESDRPGHLLVKGVVPTPAQIATLTHTDPQLVEARIEELVKMGVASRTKGGVLVSRRMERDENRRRKLRENGKKGGNPSLSKTTKNHPLENQNASQQDKPTSTSTSSIESPATTESIESDSESQSDYSSSRDDGKSNVIGTDAAFAACFEERFWPMYPRKVGKGEAKRKFVKQARKHTAKRLVQALCVQKAHWDAEAKETQFIPHAATWLHQERWSDDLSTDKADPIADRREDGVIEGARRGIQRAQHQAEIANVDDHERIRDADDELTARLRRAVEG
ncbi:MAG: hypothetical protein R3C70_07150 [Geminicoccaceae bacterium]